MGIYIKGMAMPTKCTVCPFVRDIGDYTFVGCKLNVGFAINRAFPYRHNYCPLVHVPPHGRLIDADALRQSLKESIDECHKWADEVEGREMYARVSQSLGTFVECSLRVKAAPTIIPASGGQDDE